MSLTLRIIGLAASITLVAGFIYAIILITLYSDTYLRNLSRKVLSGKTRFTRTKAIRIVTNLVRKECQADESSFASISDRVCAMCMEELAHLCDSTREQFTNACDLFLKLCSPPLYEKLDTAGHRTLTSLLSRLIKVQHSAVSLDVDIFTPLKGLETAKAAQKVAESHSPSLSALHDECISIRADLNAVLDTATTALCASLPSTPLTQNACKNAADAEGLCATEAEASTPQSAALLKDGVPSTPSQFQADEEADRDLEYLRRPF